jgi:hypothetical protein
MVPGMSADRDHAPVASPCISVCAIDPVTGLCSGCLRTLDEIAVWSVLDDDEKRMVLAEIAIRRGTQDGT